MNIECEHELLITNDAKFPWEARCEKCGQEFLIDEGSIVTPVGEEGKDFKCICHQLRFPANTFQKNMALLSGYDIACKHCTPPVGEEGENES